MREPLLDSTPERPVNKQVALVTGAGRGIGRGIGIALGQAGWAVVVNYLNNSAAAEETVTIIKGAGGEAISVKADVASPEQHKHLLEQVIGAYGRIDLLVNNAGMAPRQRADILDTSEASYDEVMAVNLKGPFFLTQRVARLMIDLRAAYTIHDPMIVNIGSMSAYTSSPNRSEYCLSKAGMGMMTLLFADRLAEYGIRVYEVRPGIISTDMTHVVAAKYDKLISEGLTPIRRWGQPEDVARIVVAIAQGALPFSTGEIINVDGGLHFHRL
ncbi:MAG TPA: 3-ketoacyl-ACP reductase [Aggregatilineales bacterium]|nr:3-ketoacyl-ACP reductase [Aggregatilineales bacterium]